MKIKMDSFGDRFNPLLSNGVIWTSMSNSKHKCRLCNKNFKHLIVCNVELSYNSKWGYKRIKQDIWFSDIPKEVKSVVVIRLQQFVPDLILHCTGGTSYLQIPFQVKG